MIDMIKYHIMYLKIYYLMADLQIIISLLGTRSVNSNLLINAVKKYSKSVQK